MEDAPSFYTDSKSGAHVVMSDCCNSELRSESINNMLNVIVDSKIISIEVFTAAVAILFVVVLLKNKFRNFCGT
ncbi:hypothetical protein FF38_07426 [Lucilia cuprina]|uniref:Uncharacterized protein n=2 Tax=Lucilia cuprina TaxID=7375 RepID=A0A0L0BVG7_LUCCU|nr:hypothetical protein FF38_07426 [Lucilia cuprina]